jgi:hypothetical protein
MTIGNEIHVVNQMLFSRMEINLNAIKYYKKYSLFLIFLK